MEEGTFYFILALLGLACVVIFIEWLWRKFEIPDEDRKHRHTQLMKEIRRHDDEE